MFFTYILNKRKIVVEDLRHFLLVSTPFSLRWWSTMSKSCRSKVVNTTFAYLFTNLCFWYADVLFTIFATDLGLFQTLCYCRAKLAPL